MQSEILIVTSLGICCVVTGGIGCMVCFWRWFPVSNGSEQLGYLLRAFGQRNRCTGKHGKASGMAIELLHSADKWGTNNFGREDYGQCNVFRIWGLILWCLVWHLQNLQVLGKDCVWCGPEVYSRQHLGITQERVETGCTKPTALAVLLTCFFYLSSITNQG
ncbi:hypothetical protein BDN67DRAFT_986082 [Paxillus ammoniavirescens]|nr:hypothetical protein BDN67DRAFT_986082 [Paxillus ammoniavirescens]